jgi:predicted permease
MARPPVGEYVKVNWVRKDVHVHVHAYAYVWEIFRLAGNRFPHRSVGQVFDNLIFDFRKSMDTLIRDIRYGLKRLGKDRGFLFSALLTLGLCVGANSAIFSVVRSVLLKPLPFPESERVVLIYNSYPNANAPRSSAGVPDYYDRLEGTTAFEEIALVQNRGLTVGEPGATERLTGARVTPSFFRLVRTSATAGRTFTEEEGQPGSERHVVLSWGFWQERFAGRPDAVGQDVRIDGLAYSIVGVMPREFLYENPEVRMWIPLAFSAEQRSDENRHSNNFQMIARIRAGVSLEQAQAQIDAVNSANMERFPQWRELLTNAGFHTVVTSLRTEMTRAVRSTLLLLQVGVLLVLVIGCVNIANLILVRASSRTREMATRLALGAGRGRLARQLLTESVVLGLLGGLLGLVVGRAGLLLFSALGAADLPRGSEIRMDASVTAFTFALAALAGLLFGGLPVLRLRNADLSTVFREEGRTGTAGRSTMSLRGTLVSAQVAAAFALLIAAGLILVSFARTLAVDPGFETDGLLTANVSLPVTRYHDHELRTTFQTRALDRIRALPGVTLASATTQIPFSGDVSSSVVTPQGYVPQPGESPISPIESFVANDFFETMGIELVSGRTFTPQDGPDSEPVIIIDEWLARRYWPNEDPVGRGLYEGIPEVGLDNITQLRRIVGVVREIRVANLVGEQPAGHYYIPLTQNSSTYLVLTIRTSAADPAAALSAQLRSAIAEIDPDLPVYGITTMRERAAASLRTERARAALLLAFGGIALTLAAIGIYGVLAYAVSLRTSEIGIRMALGSPGGAVFGLVLRQGLAWVGAGLLAGLLASLALGRMLRGLVHGVGTTDPLVFGAVLLVLAAVAVAACIVPARRAARVSPIVAMREGTI